MRIKIIYLTLVLFFLTVSQCTMTEQDFIMPRPVALEAVEVTSVSFVARWNMLATAQSYLIDISKNENFSGATSREVQGDRVRVEDLDIGETYYYRLRAKIGNTLSAHSNVIKVTLGVSALRDLEALPPTEINLGSFKANWRKVEKVQRYAIEVAQDFGFTQILPNYRNFEVQDTSLLISGLESNKTYFYRVRIRQGNFLSGASNTMSVTTSALRKPLALSATETDLSSFQANWEAETGVDLYWLEVAEDAEFKKLLTDYQAIEVRDTKRSVRGLEPQKTYYYRIKYRKEGFISDFSNVVAATTTSLPRPVALSASNVGLTTFQANWRKTAGAESYQIEISEDGEFKKVLPEYNYQVSDSFLVIRELKPQKSYYYRLRYRRQGFLSDYSNAIAVNTFGFQTPVALPASNISQTSFQANWKEDKDAESYFIDVATDPQFNNILSEYKNIEIRANTLRVIRDLEVEKTYYYRIRIQKDRIFSEYSNTIQVSTVSLAPPVALGATEVKLTSAILTWTKIAEAESYSLEIATDQEFKNILPNWNGIDIKEDRRLVENLQPKKVYYYRLKARKGTISSIYSNIVSFTTDELAKPIALAATKVDFVSFQANWRRLTGAQTYLLEVATDIAFTQVLPAYRSVEISDTLLLVTGLDVKKTYYYRIRAKQSGVNSEYSNIISLVTLGLEAPFTQDASDVGYVSFQANWVEQSAAESYRLEVSEDPLFRNLLSGYSSLTVRGRSQVIVGLTADKSYYYRLRAIKGNFVSEYSRVISVNTKKLATPKALPATDIALLSFKANWEEVPDAPSYILEVATDIAFVNKLLAYEARELTTLSEVILGLITQTNYYYRIRAKGYGSFSEYSNIIGVTTLGLPAPVATAPSDVTLTAFRANWDLVPNATSYLLEVATNFAFTNFVTGYNPKTTTASSEVLTGLIANQTYYYRLRAVGSGTTSAFSNTMNITTQLLVAPAVLAPTNETLSSFRANWSAVAGASTYILDVATDAAFTNLVAGYNAKELGATSENIVGLNASTTYFYRVSSKGAGVVSVHSTTQNATTLTLPPPTVSAATIITLSSFQANWASVTDATTYFIDVATDLAFTNILANYNNKEIAGTSTSIINLDAGTNYYYRVRSKAPNTTSLNSTTISLSTLTLASPVAVAATAVGLNSFQANWNAVPNAGSYLLDVATDLAFTNFVVGYQNKELLTTNDIVNVPNANTDYYYRVRAKAPNTTSVYSNIVLVSTSGLVSPVALAATNITYTTMQANWNAVPNATSYLLDVATDLGFTNRLAAYQDFELSPTNLVLAGLIPNTTYHYRLRAKNGATLSAYSNTFTTTTQQVGTPTATAASTVQSASFQANWNAVPDATSYLIDVALDNAFGAIITGYNAKEITGTSTSITGLNPNTTYYYRVRAKYLGILSNYSNTISQATSLIPAPLTLSAAIAVPPLQFTARWTAVAEADNYVLDVAENAAFSVILPNYNGKVISGTSEIVTGLDPKKYYYYRVRAKRGVSLSTYSGTENVESGVLTTCTLTRERALWNGLTEINFAYTGTRVNRIEHLGLDYRFDIYYLGTSNNIRIAYRRARLTPFNYTEQWKYTYSAGKVSKIELYAPNDASSADTLVAFATPTLTAVWDFTYNGNGDITDWKIYSDAAILVTHRTYTYDAAGNVIETYNQTTANTEVDISYNTTRINPCLLLNTPALAPMVYYHADPAKQYQILPIFSKNAVSSVVYVPTSDSRTFSYPSVTAKGFPNSRQQTSPAVPARNILYGGTCALN